MARLIDVPAGTSGAAPLVVQVGDVVACAASGARLGAGPLVLEQLGPLLPAVVGLDGRVLAPEGPPSTVLFVARAPGRATLQVMTGDPWGTPVTTAYVIDVEA